MAEIEMTEEERANAMGAMGWKGTGCLENKTIGDEGITVDFWIIKATTSN